MNEHKQISCAFISELTEKIPKLIELSAEATNMTVVDFKDCLDAGKVDSSLLLKLKQKLTNTKYNQVLELFEHDRLSL